MLKQRVQKFIEERSLFTLADKVLVALSGGADSVALLRVLLSLGHTCECAHCNFHLRGEESNRDEAFVHHLCKDLGVKLHITHFDTEAYAKEHRLSIEMAARELRYAWFETLRHDTGASVIAVAHHRDDSVETFLLNLIRGTGINGLKGINPQNGRVVRPLLHETRANLLEYLTAIGQDYVTDSTNLQDEYLRNKIRLHVLPLMQELNPSVAESIASTSERVAEVANIYHKDRQSAVLQKMKRLAEGEYRIRISDVLNDVAPLSLLHESLSPLGFNSSQTKDMYLHLNRRPYQSGKCFHSSAWEVLCDREELIVRQRNQSSGAPVLQVELVDLTPSFAIPRGKEIACLDAEKVKHPLTVRKWQHGDKFVPFGMTGKKKVSDYLTDKKFTLYEKEEQYVVCSGEDIVWLVNERSDNRFRVTEKTRQVLLLTSSRTHPNNSQG